MKTPREILLARHEPATPQLDALRQRVVADLSSAPAEPIPQRRSLIELLGEFFRLPRPVLIGIAAAWVVVIALNIASHDAAMEPSSKQGTPRPVATKQDLHEQKRLFAELVRTLNDTEAEAPRFTPRPRGDIKPPFIYV